jgi:hypothetical protein
VHHQDDDRHHRRPRDRRVRAHEHHEAEQHGDRHGRPQDPWRTDRAAEQHHERHEHGAVRAGHGGQVGQRGGLHGLLRRRVESGPVTDGESPEECCSGLGEVRGHGDEGRTRDGTPAEETARTSDGLCRSAGEQDERGRRPGRIRLELSADPHDRSGRQHRGARRVERRHEPDRHPQGRTARARPTADGLEPADHRPVPGAQVTGEEHLGGHRATGHVADVGRFPASLPDDDCDGHQPDEQGRRQHQTRADPDRGHVR